MSYTKPIPDILNPLIEWMIKKEIFDHHSWKEISEDVQEQQWISHVLFCLIDAISYMHRLDFYRHILQIPTIEKDSLELFQNIGLLDFDSKIKKEFVDAEKNYAQCLLSMNLI